MLEKEFINPHPMGFTSTVTYSIGGVKTIVISGQVGYAAVSYTHLTLPTNREV